MKKISSAIILILLSVFTVNSIQDRVANQTEPTTGVEVLDVIDGDTLTVLIDGESRKIRIIGIDTPEVNKSECYADEAKWRAEELLENTFVNLESDTTQGDIDRYERLLRFVFLQDGRNFGEVMIREGYAREYTYNKAYTYQQDYQGSERKAQQDKVGLWGEGCVIGKEKDKQIQELLEYFFNLIR